MARADRERQAASELLAGGGEMGALMRSIDWARTPLGAVETWPASLRTVLRVLLASEQPMFLWWGPELVQFYNDGYRPMLGSSKHPAAMGQRGAECFKEAWGVLGPMVAAVAEGEASYTKDGLVPLDRHGFLEECYFNYGFTPVYEEDGVVGGILSIPSETTGRVLGERRLAFLQELARRTGPVNSVPDVFRAVEEMLAGCPADLPFTLIYELDAGTATLAACAGLERGTPPARVTVDLTRDGIWPLHYVAKSGNEALVDNLEKSLGFLRGTAWPEPVTRALLLPMSIGEGRTAILIAGLSPRLLVSEEYRTFLRLLSRQIAASVSSTRAIETETRRAAELAELNRAKSAFFSNVSHELRTPLTLILGPVEAAFESRTSLAGDELSLVRRNAVRLEKLVNTLLVFSRIEAGRVDMSFQETELGPLTIDIASTFRSLVENAGLTLTVECPPLPLVHVDREMYEKILLNLLSNAFKFTLAGSIDVSLDLRDSHVRLTVSDTGVGIPEAELSRVFDRFHRVAGTRGRSFEGSGIGLALVRELATLHGGTASVSSHVGQGSRFTVSIPVGKAHLPPERIGLPPSPPIRGAAEPFLEEATSWLAEDPAGSEGFGSARILLADDNADIRRYVGKLLAKQGWEVDAVSDGEAALAHARAHVPDLVLSDVMMPGMDGFALLRALKEDPITRAVPVILLSARAGEAASLEGMQRGADDYLVKPFSGKQLVSRVAARLKTARVRGEQQRELQREHDDLSKAHDFEQQLIGIVSHDLRNPLRTILHGTETLLRRRDLDERATGVVSRIQTCAEGADRMSRDLLDFTKARIGGGIPIQRRPCSLGEIVRNSLLEATTAHPGGAGRVETSGPEVLGNWDPDRLSQALSNLISNALDYSPAGSGVAVLSRSDEGSTFISVRNEGVPIPSGKLAVLFEPFQRATDLDATRRGLGLGLYIVKQIVEGHGGTVSVTSSETEGTTFTVCLPR